MGFRFRRQATLRGWIADFWCPAKRLVVEVDGWSHRNEARRIKDWVRDRRLSEEFGIKTLRFPVEAMVNNLDKVVDQVRATLASRPTAYIHCTGTNSHTRRRGVLPLLHGSMEKLETMTPEEALRAFLELDRERTDIRSIEEYVLVIRQLVDIKNVLGDAPAGTRVRTAIRDLQGCLPQIRQMDDQRLKCQTSARIVELERTPPRCPDGHSMVVRQGPNASFFWGCSSFPSCRNTKRLTREQIVQLPH